MVTLLILGMPFIAASPQKILLSILREIESEVCPGVSRIFPCNMASKDDKFWGDISTNLPIFCCSIAGKRCFPLPISPINLQKANAIKLLQPPINEFCPLRSAGIARLCMITFISGYFHSNSFRNPAWSSWA